MLIALRVAGPALYEVRALGIPLQNTHVTVVSIRSPKMIPHYNRGGDWKRYGSLSDTESEHESEEGSEVESEDEL